jgi:hypothetical protein
VQAALVLRRTVMAGTSGTLPGPFELTGVSVAAMSPEAPPFNVTLTYRGHSIMSWTVSQTTLCWQSDDMRIRILPGHSLVWETHPPIPVDIGFNTIDVPEEPPPPPRRTAWERLDEFEDD